MKAFFFAGLLFAALVSRIPAQAQTNAIAAEAPKSDVTNQIAKASEPYPVTAIIVSNTITFPILLSAKSEPLMTNAVYHRTFGRKVIFAADLALRSFDIDKLHPSVIAQLDLDTNKVKADQETLDKQNQEWALQNQQKNQQLLSAEAAALAKTQAEAQSAANSKETNSGATPAPGTGKKGHHKPGTPATLPPAN